MSKVLLMLRENDIPVYLEQLKTANLPNLEIVGSIQPDVEIVFGDPGLISRRLTELPALKWVQATWAGVEPLLQPGLPRNYILTNARGVFGGLMSEYVFGYLLFHERRIQERLEAQKQSKWDPRLTGTLSGKTIGLLGVGSIGAHLAETARHFGMRVRGYTRQSESSPHVDQYFHGQSLQAFAENLDVLVSVLPNTPFTSKIVNADLLKCLPAQAIFINAGRGSTVDEQALLSALNAGKLSMAVLDVFDQEPLPAGHPFWQTKNLFITSHTAAPSFPKDITGVFVKNYAFYISGQPLNYQVDFELGY